MKILKYTLLALGGLVILIGAGLAYVAATFDPNQYKPQIIAAVKEKTQRTLRLEGDIALSFWPNIGAKIGKASLSERASEREFAAVQEARVSLKLMPLLSGAAIVDTVTLKGLNANLIKGKDGKTNVEDLVGPPPGKEPAPAPRSGGPLEVDIAGVDIQNATIRYTDLAAGTRYALSNLDLKTGRIAAGVPTPIALSVHARSDQPKVDLKTSLKTRLAFDPGQSLTLDDLDLEAKGAAAGITDLALRATGAAMANVKTGDFTASKLKVSLTGKRDKDALDVRADVPRLHLAGDKAAGDKVSIVATINRPDGVTKASLTMPGFEGTAQAFRSSAARLDLDVNQGDLAVKAQLDSPVTGNVRAQQVSLPQLRATINASGPHLPGKAVAGQLAGSASLDGLKQQAQANLAGRIGDSGLKARVNVAGFGPLALNFNLDVDQLDADRYLPPKAASGGPKPAGKGGPGQREEPFDLTALRDLRADGKIHFGALKVNDVKARNVRIDVKANGGRVNLDPVTANLYEGKLASAIVINAKPATPTFAVKHALNGVNIGPLLRDAADNDVLEGRGTVRLDVTTQGSTVSALKRALNGKAAVKLVDGAIKGIDIAGTLRSAKARLGQLRGEQVQAADKTRKTDFSELTATLNIKNGVAHNDDLSIKSPLLRAGGEGNINIGEGTLNYMVNASVVGTTKGQGGRGLEDLKGLTVPVRVSGPLANPSYKLDYSAVVTESAKQRITDELEKRLGGEAKPGATKKDGATKDERKSGTRDVLRGILGR